MTMFKLLDKSEWDLAHREPRQTYKDYFDRVSKLENHFKLGAESLQNSEGATKAQLMELTRLLAWMSNDYLIYSYSAGVRLSVLAEFTPTAIDYWECFSQYDLDFDNSPESDGHRVPHIDLYDRDYWFALQLVSFSILLGHPELLHNIMTLLIYENDDQDALLEAMVAPWLPGRPGSAIYTRELPYRKTRKIFAAKPEKRAELLAQYLDEWYAASRREPYFDRHKSSRFPGYWALEAGVITFILDIDDSAYREKPFYPRDLVDYARQYAPKPGCFSVNDGDKHDQRRPNVPANHPCPNPAGGLPQPRPARAAISKPAKPCPQSVAITVIRSGNGHRISRRQRCSSLSRSTAHFNFGHFFRLTVAIHSQCLRPHCSVFRIQPWENDNIDSNP